MIVKSEIKSFIAIKNKIKKTIVLVLDNIIFWKAITRIVTYCHGIREYFVWFYDKTVHGRVRKTMATIDTPRLRYKFEARTISVGFQSKRFPWNPAYTQMFLFGSCYSIVTHACRAFSDLIMSERIRFSQTSFWFSNRISLGMCLFLFSFNRI